MVKIEKVYGTVFEGILGEKISTKPVEIVHPFPWHARKNQGRLSRCLRVKNEKGERPPSWTEATPLLLLAGPQCWSPWCTVLQPLRRH